MDKFLALDVGKARIGVATGDPLGITVRPLAVVQRTSNRKDFARLAQLLQEAEATAILCGLPLNMDGSEGEQAQWTRKWARKLAHAMRADLGKAIPIIFWDERLSTFAAQELLSAMSTSGGDDAVAAAVILRSFLNAQKRGDGVDWGRIELTP
ncbi:MAG: Holliday junction resolvase RuvX [Caldilineaceae bacterium]|nr:Holliday junction resolvase RuvX [Caldilineaceae bacterium]